MSAAERTCATAGPQGHAGGSEHCITCGDDGVPMRVLRVDHSRGLALCEDRGGAHGSVEIALVDPVAPGDLLLVHAGTALTRLQGTSA
jgi:hydrogenase assembly chaperone HypC/HupF